ncbi:unnamed protein product, partial [Symbiodinium sp. KB8]
YSWHTEHEMVSELKWPEAKVKGAMELCNKRRLTKKCLYSQEMKYLVLVSDKVESGSSRTRSLEQEMNEAGIWDTDFSLGDLINLDDESEGKNAVETKETKTRIPEFPAVDGPESLQEFLGQYKKACLNKKASTKAAKERFQKDGTTGTDMGELEKVHSNIASLYQQLTGLEVTPAGSRLGKETYASIVNSIRRHLVVAADDLDGDCLGPVLDTFVATSAKAAAKQAAGAGKNAQWTPNYTEKLRLQLLGSGKNNVARNMAKRIRKLGLMLDVLISYVDVPYVKIGLCKHAMLGVVDFAEYLANSEEYAYKLLAGYATTESCKWKAEFASFWQKFATVEPHHDVFRRYNHCLGNCCPIFLHGDEGTSYGKKGLFQFSWSPVLSAGASGLHRYFMISQLSYKFYAKLAKGNAKGNPALDAIMAAGCQSCWTAYEVGVKCGQERIYLVTIGLTGGDSTLMMLWLQDYMESIPHDMSDPLLLVNLCYFNLVPKIHYLAHVALNLHKALDAGTHILNPSVWATPMAEDY